MVIEIQSTDALQCAHKTENLLFFKKEVFCSRYLGCVNFHRFQSLTTKMALKSKLVEIF